MGLRDALGTLTFPVSGALLGFSVPFLIMSVELLNLNSDGQKEAITCIVFGSLLVLFAAVSTLLSLQGFIVSIFPNAFGGSRIKPRHSGAIVFALQAVALLSIMIAFSIYADTFWYLPYQYGWHMVDEATYEQVEALVNGTTHPPPWWHNDTGMPDWKLMELSQIINSNEWESTTSTIHWASLSFLGIGCFVLGWILFSLLVISFFAAVVPPQRTFWFECSPGGITVRWKDSGIALPVDDDEVNGNGEQSRVELSRTAETAV